MKNILNELVQVERYTSYQILQQVVNTNTEIQIKIADKNRIIKATLKKIGERKHFYVIAPVDAFADTPEITAKVLFNDKLYFLKTELKKFQGGVYFENYENMFELVRRKNPRFQIPKHWPQSAYIQATHTAVIQPKKVTYLELSKVLKSVATIKEMSKSGMKLEIATELPRYDKSQILNIRFKVFRRAEIQIVAKIIHLKKNVASGPTIGVQFLDDSILIKNKIQNVCDDLAFFYTALGDR